MLEDLKNKTRLTQNRGLCPLSCIQKPKGSLVCPYFAVCVVGYVFSPIDLIPDPIPLIGYLDDLILVPLGIAIALKMIPKEVMVECREQAKASMLKGKPVNWIAAIGIIGIWVGL